MTLTAKERQRRFRALAKAGIKPVRVLVGPDDIEALVDAGLLPFEDGDDKERIAEAVERLLADTRGPQGSDKPAVPLRVDNELVGALVRAGHLPSDGTVNREKIADVLIELAREQLRADPFGVTRYGV